MRGLFLTVMVAICPPPSLQADELEEFLAEERVEEFSEPPGWAEIPGDGEASKQSWADESSSRQRFRALLKRGSIIRDSKTSKRYLVDKNLLVWAEEEFPSSPLSFIYIKGDGPKYTTLTRNLSSIEKDLDLHPYSER